MQYRTLVSILIAFALAGCEKASEPVTTASPQIERKDQQSGSPPQLLWSVELRDQTLKECIQSATAEMNTAGVKKCRCVVEKASTTIPEQRFKSIQSDPAVKDQIKQIGASC